MSAEPAVLLTDDARRALQDAIADAVMSSPSDLRDRMGHDPAASLALVLSARTAAEETSRLLRDAVTSARGAGHSWDVIGRLLGVSRQAAQQRFGTAETRSTTQANGSPERRVLTPLTAFNEMAVLEVEGEAGWHVVEYGTLFHVVEASDRRWEHRRAPWSPGVTRRMTQEGWTLVQGMTFPWGYYKRTVD